MMVIFQASRLNLIRYNTQWILGNLDMSDTDLQRINLDPNQVNIAAFKQPCAVSLLRKDAYHKGSTISVSKCMNICNLVNFFISG